MSKLYETAYKLYKTIYVNIFLESELNNIGCKAIDNTVYLNWVLYNLNDVESSGIYHNV